MSSHEIVLATPDATLRRYARDGGRLILDFELWDESMKQVVAMGVTRLTDTGTWESDALVRVPDWDSGASLGYGVISVEGELTLRFTAEQLLV